MATSKQKKTKPNYNSKSKRISIRFTYEELEDMANKMKQIQLKNRSEYIKKRFENGEITVHTVDSSTSKLVFELNKIGVNLNQIAHKINETNSNLLPLQDELKGLIETIKPIISRLIS